MYLFYDQNGKILHYSGARSPENKLTSIPEGTTPLYLDDEEYPDVKEKYSYYTIENNIPAYFTYVPDSVRLPSMQQAKIEEINLACNLEILGGFESSVLGGEHHHYKFDMEYQANMNQQMGLLSLDPTIELIPWPTSSGVLIHTKSQFVQLLKDASDFKSSKLFRYFDMKEQIMNAETTDEVKLINW